MREVCGRIGSSMVFCLALDMVDSTRAGLNLATSELDRFNVELVEQIKPHLRMLMLGETSVPVLKFEGDGWLVMSNDAGHVAALCCLGLIMCYGFQTEMGRRTGLRPEYVPAMRAALCAGQHVLWAQHQEDQKCLIDETSVAVWVLPQFIRWVLMEETLTRVTLSGMLRS